MARKTNCTVHGNQRFRVTAVVGHDPMGKAVRKNFYGKSEKEAVNKRDAYLRLLEEGIDFNLANQTVGKAMHTWLFEVKKADHDLKASSFVRYYGLYEKYIKGSSFGALIVSEVKSLSLQRYLNQLAKEEYTVSQIKNAYKLIKMFFTYAAEEGYTTKNPCTRSIVIPGEKVKKDEVETFTDEEIEKLKTALATDRLRLLYLMALGTGLRKGELLALRYEDVAVGAVQVHSSLARVTEIEEDGTKTTGFKVWEPKSSHSRRRVPLPKSLEKEVSAHRARQIAERMAIGIGGEPEFIFTTETGNFIDPSNFTTGYTRLLKRAGIPHKKFHALRHTFATKLVQAGADISTIQKLMGHSSITITNIYFHGDHDVMDTAVQTLDRYFQ